MRNNPLSNHFIHVSIFLFLNPNVKRLLIMKCFIWYYINKLIRMINCRVIFNSGMWFHEIARNSVLFQDIYIQYLDAGCAQHCYGWNVYKIAAHCTSLIIPFTLQRKFPFPFKSFFFYFRLSYSCYYSHFSWKLEHRSDEFIV